MRHILYLRPSMYVVIDDLATAKAGGSEFEWNLHTDDSLEFRSDNTGATVAKGSAEMNVQFHGSTAQNLRTTLETKFISASGTEVQPGGSFSGEKQIHAAFVTPKTNAVKLISTLEPYKRGSAPQSVASSETTEVVKLSFADGTNVYVRKTDSGTVDAGDGIRFDGSAVAVKGDSILLANGTKVERNGVSIIASSAPSTIAYGDDRLSLTAQADATIALNAPGLTQVLKADTGDVIPAGGDVAAALNARGMHYTFANGVATIQIEKGQKSYKLNHAPIPGPLAPVTLLTEVDGVPGEVTLQAHSDVDGVSVAWGQLSNVSGFYEVVEAPEGFLFERHGKIGSGLLEANARVILKGDTGVLKLRTIGADSSKPTVLYDVPNAERETRNMEWQEAENFVQWGNKAPSVYTTRPFLSGGKGMGEWNQVGQWVKWQMNVPRAGTYDVLLKYVGGWDLPAGQTQNVRYLQLGDQVSYFEAPKTFDFGTKEEYWKGLRVRTGQFLPAGQVEMTMWLQLGSMNLDWIALVEVKDDEIRPTAPTGLALDSRTEQAAVISWNGATDDVAVKEYAIYVDGVRKMAVPAGTHTATLTDLAPGKQYNVRVRTVDTSDNLSYEPPGATGIQVSLADITAPTWSAAATWTDLLLKDVARIAWAGATDVSGVKEYDVYRLDVSDTVPIATVSDRFYNATGLQPGGTYSFRIEARDPQGNTSVGGPTATVTTPLTSIGFFDSFDAWTVGDAINGNGWEYPTRTNGTAVKVVPIPGIGGNGLQAIDSFHSEADPYATTPRFYRTMAPIGGKMTIETRTKFTKVNHEVGNYSLELVGGNRTIAMLVGFSDGGIGYQKMVNGKLEYARLTESGFTQPVDEWMTVRFDADFSTMTYDLIVQLDKLKSYSGVIDPNGTLDRTTGTYVVENIPFIEVTPFLRGIEMFRISAQRYTGIYTFDYVALYPTPEPDVAAPTTTDDAPESGVSKQDLVVNLTATDDRSPVAYTKYSINGGEPATGNSVVLTTEGVHAIAYWSADAAGNVETPRTVTITLDKTAPITTSDAPNAASSDVTVNLTATDSLSGAVLTQYAVNGGEPVEGNAVLLTEEGVHTIQYWSTDAAGNVEEPKTATVTIDKATPVTTATVEGTIGSEGWYRGPVSVLLTATDAQSGVSRSEYRLDNGEWTAAVGPIVVAADGVHLLEYRSVDAAGNAEASKTLELRIDATAPALNVQLDRSSIWPPNKKLVDILATLASDDATSGVASVTLTSVESNEPEDGSIEAAIGTSADTFRLKADRNGNGDGDGRVYTITYTATDAAGNVSTAVATVTVPHDQ
ncbi:OmpL47-type beta-barrel domain-containing protein [Paenibacillus antri]|nr:fibronectin type III domain-containing protein [Paenibacillus antri]